MRVRGAPQLASERGLIVILGQIFHPAAGLDIEPCPAAAAFVVLDGLPITAGRHAYPAKIVVAVFGKLLDMKEGAELYRVQLTITVFGDLDVRLAFIVFA